MSRVISQFIASITLYSHYHMFLEGRTSLYFLVFTCVRVYMCRSDNNLWVLVLSFHLVGPKLELGCSGLVAGIF